MKIFILDKYKIINFTLPDKIEDSFLIPYDSETFVTVEANNGKWQLRSNGTTNIVNGNNLVDSIVLETYNYYSLKILGKNENIIFFILPSVEEETYKLQFRGMTSITIGSSKDCNIEYINNLVNQVHSEIKLINNEWYITNNNDEKYRTYINGKRIITAKLNIGDVIFISGLKIIWMNSFIKINNPNRCVSVRGLTNYEELEVIDNTNYTPVSDEEANIDLYKEQDYFYPIPRLVPTIDDVTIKIDAPPGNEDKEEMPLILTLGTSLTMASSSLIMGFNIFSSSSSGKKSLIFFLPQIIMIVCMLLGSLVFPRIIASYQKKKRKRREKKRQIKYKEYLQKKDEEIQYAIKNQSQIIRENNVPVSTCYDIIMKKNRSFWSREITDEDFLRVRLGIGDVKSHINVEAPTEKFTLDPDNLQELAFDVDKRSKKLIDVPITITITDKTILSFVFDCSYKDDYINSLLIQLLALHSSMELKLVIFTTEINSSRWHFAKFLPHIFSDDKQTRFFASNQQEMKEVSAYIENEFKERQNSKKESKSISDSKDDTYKAMPSYYLIITDDYKNVKNIPIIEFIFKENKNLGFTLLTISTTMKNLPNKCETFIEIGEKESCILEKKLSLQSQVIFKNESIKSYDMNDISVKLSNVPVITKNGLTDFPASLSFLDMYNVGKIEQLNILNRWKTNNPVTSLSTIIGVHKDGELFKLDLHEKFHGPHGLIAGSTGSGKSEFIITYILSMCVNYHPYEVQFVLIDYKGGGLAGAFENKETRVKIPHLVGTITNLDTAEMNRTLVSISSELKRRQKKFNEVKDKLDESTMDIYKYQRLYREGLIDTPMAHLFIISDEFAELKSQQPEFLNELVSTARIGRSLGVHLILATQKPTGVVNDQIWSNSKFKICLKVQDKSDSTEILKKPDAASIKEAGRFYLQVGYDDYFAMGQSGWGGAKYVPTDRIIKKTDDSINFINNTGEITKSINDIIKKENSVDLGEQLTNIVKYIYNLANKETIKTSNLWLDKIPDVIFIDGVKKKYSYKSIPYFINPVIGEYDNPKDQEQGLLNLNITDGNTLIVGKTGSGKENLISTIIWSSSTEHTPNEVSFYIIDCGAETLKMFYKFPFIGNIATIDEEEQIMNILSFVNDEIERRKDEYADYAGNYKNYCENSGKKEPLIVVIINNYEIFSETYSRVADGIQTMYRDGDKYGVKFIISCTTSNGMRTRIAQYFNTKLVLQLTDPLDYRNVFNAPRGMVPFKAFGRGLVITEENTYEFQTANIYDLKQISTVIKNAAEKLNSAYTTRAKKIKSIPELIKLTDLNMENISINKIPIGYSINTKDEFYYNFVESKINIITGNKMSSNLGFVIALIKIFSKISNINLKVLDFAGAFESNYNNVKLVNDNFDNEIIKVNNEIATELNNIYNNFYIIIGLEEIRNKLSEKSYQILTNLFMASSTYKKTNFILIDNYSSFKQIQLENWYQSQVNSSNGIWLGSDVGSQMIINIIDISLEEKQLKIPYLGYVVNKGEFEIIKCVIDVEE